MNSEASTSSLSSQAQRLIKTVITQGVGDDKPSFGDTVAVHYTGTLPGGEVFECTRSEKKPIEYIIGKGKLIRAWEAIVIDMTVGERCKVTCPPELGYGETGLPPKIPPNAILTFDIELLLCLGENVSDTKDTQIIRKTSHRGSGPCPNYNSTVKVHLECCVQKQLVDRRDVEFTIGQGYLNDVPLAVDVAVRKFKPGEESRLKFRRDLCDGLNEEKVEQLPEADVCYTLSLLSITQQVSAIWNMDTESKLMEAERSKSLGAELLKEGRYRLALRQYRRCKELLKDDPNFTEEQSRLRQALMLACHLNRALCRLKREQWRLARDDCGQALWMDIGNEKAYYRRALACIGSCDFYEAVNDLKRVLEINPDNKAAKNQLIRSEAELKKQSNAHRNTFGGMFQKFAHNDSKVEALNEAKGLLQEPIGYWSNEMADGMLSIDQEMQAFEGAAANGDGTAKQG